MARTGQGDGRAAPPSPSRWGVGPVAPLPSHRMHSRWRGIMVRSLGLGIAALWFAFRGSWLLVTLAVGTAVVVAVLAALSPRAAHLLDEGARKLGTGAAACIATVGVGVVDVLVGLPGRAFSALRRRSPLTSIAGAPTSTWRQRTSDLAERDLHDRPWSADVPGRRTPRHGAPRVSRLLLGLAALVVLDALVGSLVPLPQFPSWVEPTARVHGEAEPGVPGVPETSPAAQASGPALAGTPWGETCLREAADLQYDYVQFLVRRIRDTHGACIVVRDGERNSYVPEGATKEVWLLGGSAAFGEGQRDDHTIASELARASEAAGSPVRVRNFAVPGFTAYQEALLLEQLVATLPAPDLVILYDGVNDVAAQIASPTDQATWLPFTLWRSSAPAATRSLWTRWSDSSFVAQGWDWLVGEPASALPEQSRPAPREVAQHVIATYGRGVELAERVAAARGVEVLTIFQATTLAADHEVTRLVVADLPDGIVDLSDALHDAPSTAIDAVHTNEDGSRRIAAAIIARARGTALDPAGS